MAMMSKRRVITCAVACTCVVLMASTYLPFSQDHPERPVNEKRRERLRPLEWQLPQEKNKPMKVYPVNGTGRTVDISGHFDASVFNSFCDTKVAIKAVLPVYSTVDRFELRDILRNTLGKWAQKLNCKMFFISGVSLNASVNEKIKEEYVREKDILMMDKIDAYRHLNDKATAMVRWLSQYCQHVPYVIHLIDDAFINLELFLNRLDTIPDKNYILGGFMRIRAPRNNLLKTFVTKEEYPNNMFPDYAIGFAYAFPNRVSKRLFSVVNTADFCWIEDVWFTGHVREAAGVRLIRLRRREWKADEDKPVPGLLDGLPPYFIVHSVEPELFYQLYSTVIN